LKFYELMKLRMYYLQQEVEEFSNSRGIDDIHVQTCCLV
jgi:hypothetical protein